MMFGVTAARLGARPRAASASLSALARPAAASSPSLSRLFDSQCSLSTALDHWRSVTTSRSVAATATAPSGRWRLCSPLPEVEGGTRALSSGSDAGGAAPPGDGEGGGGEATPHTISGSSQHDAWVQYQREISVSGVDTGQMVTERIVRQGRSRGGKQARKRKERLAELERKMKGVDNTELKGGEFPVLRYSDEETERLLAEAYAKIPPRAGKRGTRNLKRQKRRWFIKRQYDYKKKLERQAALRRKLEKKENLRQEVIKVRKDSADVRRKEDGYHSMVLQRWAEMNGHNEGLRALEEPRRKELTDLGWNI